MRELRGERVTLRPIGPGDTPVLRAIRAQPSVARWWGPNEPDFPAGDEPDSTRLAIVVDGAVAGMIQFGEEREPAFRHASIDVFVSAEHQGRGLGTDAVGTLAGHLLDARGHHRLTIDPAASNEAAIRCYARVGFEPVGVMRAYSRDPQTGAWIDGLLMELVRLPREGTAASPTGSSGWPRG